MDFHHFFDSMHTGTEFPPPNISSAPYNGVRISESSDKWGSDN